MIRPEGAEWLRTKCTVNGGAGTDTVQMTSPVTLTDADFTHFQSIEVLGLTGVSSVTLGTKALAEGLSTVIYRRRYPRCQPRSGSLTVAATEQTHTRSRPAAARI